MKRADKQIIDANPNLQPHQLLDKGLSQDGYLELLQKANEVPAKKLQPTIPQMPTAKPLQPIVSAVPAKVNSGVVRIAPRGGTGGGTTMSRAMAEAMQRRQPNLYVIIG